MKRPVGEDEETLLRQTANEHQNVSNVRNVGRYIIAQLQGHCPVVGQKYNAPNDCKRRI